jgi:hypothetical protein
MRRPTPTTNRRSRQPRADTATGGVFVGLPVTWAYPAAMTDRLPPPGPSFLRERELRIDDRTFRAGMARPSDGPEGWWLAVLWVADDEGVISFADVAPTAGPPPDPPLLRLGPAVAGGLSGLILEENGRLAIRLTPVAPPDDPTRPWRSPLAIRAAFKWEPARAATMRQNEMAGSVLEAFSRAVAGLHRR